jgi:sugar phosphate isomerase/epimerase
MVRDLIAGRDVDRLAVELRKAGVERCTDSLLYKWANPNAEQKPSIKGFLLLVKICENCGPIDTINEACGKVGVPDDDYREGIKAYTAEFEKRERLKCRDQGPGVRGQESRDQGPGARGQEGLVRFRFP